MGAPFISASDLYAELQDPAAAAQSLQRYEAEMVRRFGPCEKWPKPDAELSPQERRALDQKRQALCEIRERKDEKRRRRMARIEARWQMNKVLPPFAYTPIAPAAAPESSDWPECIDLNALAQRAPRAPDFIIEPAWLPPGYAALFAGHGGVGKSGIALHLAVCIAMGHHFCGLVTKQRRVLYLSCEDRENILHWRLARICAFEGITLGDLAKRLEIVDLVGHDPILYARDPRTGESRTPAYWALAERMEALDTELLVVDGVTDAFGGNENSKVEVKQFVNSLLALINADRGAVLLIGHVAKPTASAPNTSEGYSGTTGWHNAARARWYLYPETEPGDDYGGRLNRTGRLHLELQKSNYGAADQAMSFVWNDRVGLFVGEMAQSSVSPAGRATQDQQDKLALLAAGRNLMAKGLNIPAARSGSNTAFHVLSANSAFPAGLKRGQHGRKRFWRLLTEMLNDQLVKQESYQGGSRHQHTRLVFP